jgi:hypothetical protein
MILHFVKVSINLSDVRYMCLSGVGIYFFKIKPYFS